jgi:branched-subunit amino acid aminotransferase/4-amino-4-deoxychorismate lyase
LITPILDGTILPGIVRDSVLVLIIEIFLVIGKINEKV